MGIRLVWEKSYAIGVPEVDKQHRQLFILANALPEDPDGTDIKRAIMTLYKHTREHFAFEEELMLKMGYPKRHEHIRLHEELIQRLNDSCQNPGDDLESVVAVRRILLEWVAIHIANHDRDYARFARELHPAST